MEGCRGAPRAEGKAGDSSRRSVQKVSTVDIAQQSCLGSVDEYNQWKRAPSSSIFIAQLDRSVIGTVYSLFPSSISTSWERFSDWSVQSPLLASGMKRCIPVDINARTTHPVGRDDGNSRKAGGEHRALTMCMIHCILVSFNLHNSPGILTSFQH